MSAVATEQLSTAVRGLDPGSRALLDLTLRRRIDDERIGRLLGIDPGEVARRRGVAVRRVALRAGVNGSGANGAGNLALLGATVAALPPDSFEAPERAFGVPERPADLVSAPADPVAAPHRSRSARRLVLRGVALAVGTAAGLALARELRRR